MTAVSTYVTTEIMTTAKMTKDALAKAFAPPIVITRQIKATPVS